MINELHASEFVKLPGVSKNVWDEMKRAKAFVLTSNYEGMSNSMIEAMCLGLPCISTKVSGAVDLIRNNVNGLLVENNDSKSLIDAFSQVVDNPSFAKTIGEASSSLYDKLNENRITAEWVNYINSKTI